MVVKAYGGWGGTTCDFIASRIMRTFSQHWIPQSLFPKDVSRVSGKQVQSYFLNLEVALIPESEEKTTLPGAFAVCPFLNDGVENEG